jgi:hypothetical protein
MYFVAIPSRFKVSVLSFNERNQRDCAGCENYPLLIVHRAGLQLRSLLAGCGGGEEREGVGGGEEGALIIQPNLTNLGPI